jgi:hypothetical protein
VNMIDFRPKQGQKLTVQQTCEVVERATGETRSWPGRKCSDLYLRNRPRRQSSEHRIYKKYSLDTYYLENSELNRSSRYHAGTTNYKARRTTCICYSCTLFFRPSHRNLVGMLRIH